MQVLNSKIQYPEKVEFLFEPAPYKIVYGGRGKGASWNFARALLILGSQKKLFNACCREIQKSIQESVHKLLEEQIYELGLNDFYKVLESKIKGANGTEFAFFGLKNNIHSIKSTEGIDVAWVTEAARVPKTSWEVFLPTVRRDPPYGPFGKGSEIWIDFNPELDTDETYQRFVASPPTGTVMRELNFKDNPFFPQILRRQMLDLKAKDYDSYLNIWEGKCRQTLAGAIYADQIRLAVSENRISPHVLYDAAKGCIVTFDLGKRDTCAMWVWQQIGMQHNAIDYYEDVGKDIDHFILELQRRKYIIKEIWLPHDGTHEPQAAKKSIEKQIKDFGYTVRIVPRCSAIITRINACRSMFPRININATKCADGLQALRHYQYKVDHNTGQRSKDPDHNWASHAADAFGSYAQYITEGPKKEKTKSAGRTTSHEGAQGWMG